MSHPITYFAIVGHGTPVDQPLGLVRRLMHDNGRSDEALQSDLSWRWTPVIAEWEHDSFDDELVEVTHAQAEQIVQYFRQKRTSDDPAPST